MSSHPRREYSVEAGVGKPQVVSRETIGSEAEGAAKFERELKEADLFGEARCRVRPVVVERRVEAQRRRAVGHRPVLGEADDAHLELDVRLDALDQHLVIAPASRRIEARRRTALASEEERRARLLAQPPADPRRVGRDELREGTGELESPS